MKRIKKVHVLCMVLLAGNVIATICNMAFADTIKKLRTQNVRLSKQLDEEKYYHRNDHTMVQLVVDYIDKTADTGEMEPFVFSEEGGKFMSLFDKGFVEEAE